MGFGRSLELFFVNGKPDEMLTARVFNWTGHVLKAPRTQIKQALARPEAQFTGVYMLLGEIDGRSTLYVGEGECVSDRIKQHDIKKEWWDAAIIVTTTANELNKAHVKYLESRLITLAGEAKVVVLDNMTSPFIPNLGEAAVANMEEFIDVLRVVLPAIGVSALTDRKVSSDSLVRQSSSTSPTFGLINKKHDIRASARLMDGSFVVFKGSRARKVWEGKGMRTDGYSKLHHQLVATGVIDVSGEFGVFTTDYAFESPSAAAAVCHGRTANGRLDWRIEGTGMTYAAWEELGLETQFP